MNSIAAPFHRALGPLNWRAEPRLRGLENGRPQPAPGYEVVPRDAQSRETGQKGVNHGPESETGHPAQKGPK